MTKILLVKTSSMGDIIHTLPALTDATRCIPGLQFDWVVEPAFAEIPKWHPAVKKVIPVPLRRFRKQPRTVLKEGLVRQFFHDLRSQSYDYIIDAQGLMKSALLVCLAKGLKCGLDRNSAWEPIASFAYSKKVAVDPTLHAISRMRHLFSKVLGYPLDEIDLNYGLELTDVAQIPIKKYLVFIHGTTWTTKEWPELYWSQLGQLVAEHDYEVYLPWGNEVERQRAQRIAHGHGNVQVLPKTSLNEMAGILKAARGVVTVDTGLGHLSAALNVPSVSLYGPTNPKEVGTMGLNQEHIAAEFECAPCLKQTCHYSQSSNVQPACFMEITPHKVWTKLLQVMSS